MRSTIVIGIISICFALLLYSTAIWAEHLKKTLKIWMMVLFSFGFIFDIIGTSIMFLSASEKLTLNWHSFFGYLALAIMGLHLIWAILAIWKKGNSEKYFTRFSIYAWILWMSAFISGVPNI